MLDNGSGWVPFRFDAVYNFLCGDLTLEGLFTVVMGSIVRAVSAGTGFSFSVVG